MLPVVKHLYIYIYQMLLSKATYSSYIQVIHFFVSMGVPWELNPQPFALLTQWSTTEPQELSHKKSNDFWVNFCFNE